jgi:hypothetical protein
MTKAANLGYGNDTPEFRWLNQPSVWGILLERWVTAAAVIVLQVRSDLTP